LLGPHGGEGYRCRPWAPDGSGVASTEVGAGEAAR
jgi:hypothetical protein